MNFYTLVENEKQIADVIQFEDGKVVAKYSNSITYPQIYNDIYEFIEKCVFNGMELIKEGVTDNI